MKSLPIKSGGFFKKRVQNYTLFHFFKTYTQFFAHKKAITEKALNRDCNKREEKGLHRYYFRDYTLAEFLFEHRKHFSFVQRKVMSHGRGIKFNKKDSILDVDLFGPFRNWLSY